MGPLEGRSIRVVCWQHGESPRQRASNSRPVSPLPTCRHNVFLTVVRNFIEIAEYSREDRYGGAGRCIGLPSYQVTQLHRDSGPIHSNGNNSDDGSVRTLLDKLRAKRPAPRSLAPFSRNHVSTRAPSLSIEVTPLRSMSSALGGHAAILKSSADEPSSRPLNRMVIRLP